jgi:hypothetical protein
MNGTKDINAGTNDENLEVFGGMVGPLEDSSEIMEIFVKKAKDYPELAPTEGYSMKKVSIDPALPGIKVFLHPDEPDIFGVGKVRISRQLNEDEAFSLLRLADELEARR